MLAAGQQTIDQGMTEWAKTLIAMSVGVIIPGVFLLVSEFLKHKRVQKERYETLIAERRIDAISSLYEKLQDLQIVSIPNFGTEGYSREALEIRAYVSDNQIVFGSEIQTVCEVYFTALSKAKMLTTKNNEIDLFYKVGTELGPKFYSKLNKAVENSLGGVKLQLLSSEKTGELRDAGIDMANKLVLKLREESNGSAPAT